MEEFSYNLSCQVCDYRPQCRKVITFPNGDKYTVKDQDHIDPGCINKVSNECRDCLHFIDKKCASWVVLNGAKVGGELSRCPKKLKKSHGKTT